MKAGTLHCYSCGAATSTESPVCGQCGARLAVIACPPCFGMMLQGMKCGPRCGTAGAEWQRAGAEMRGPACDQPLLRGKLGDTTLHECEKCFGLWLDPVTLERICRDAERQAVLLDAASAARAGLCRGLRSGSDYGDRNLDSLIPLRPLW